MTFPFDAPDIGLLRVDQSVEDRHGSIGGGLKDLRSWYSYLKAVTFVLRRPSNQSARSATSRESTVSGLTALDRLGAGKRMALKWPGFQPRLYLK